MQEGESELGGLKIPHGNTNPTTPTPGPQPDSSATSISEPASSAALNSEPHSPLDSQPISTVPHVNPAPSQPPQSPAPPSAQASPHPFQQFQSQQAQSPQVLQPSPKPLSPPSFPSQSINPVPTSPFANTASPNPFPNTPAAVFPNAGDVFLSEPKPKKSNLKKWLMIATASAVALAAIAIVLIFLNNDKTENSAEGSFENFMSYVMYGDNGHEDFADFNAEDFYAIDKFYLQIHTDQGLEYFTRISQIWENLSQYKEDDSNEEELSVKIKDGLDVLKIDSKKSTIPEEEILKQYLNGGENAARTYFLEYFASDGDDSNFGAQYFSYQHNYIDSVIALIQTYANNDCITGNSIDQACVDEKDLRSTYEYQDVNLAMQALHDYTLEIKDEIKIAIGELVNIGVDVL